MIAECYDLTLQCDFHPYPVRRDASFQGRTRDECHRQARAAGWRLYPAQYLAKCGACCAAGRTERTARPAEPGAEGT